MAQRADAFGNLIQRHPEFVILCLEHGVQAVEARTGDIPVISVGLGIECISLRQQNAQGVSGRITGFVVQTDIYRHGGNSFVSLIKDVRAPIVPCQSIGGRPDIGLFYSSFLCQICAETLDAREGFLQRLG